MASSAPAPAPAPSPLKTHILETARGELNAIMDKWCANYSDENFSGGKMRGDRGDDIELFVRNVINDVGKALHVDLVAIKGDRDKKDLVIPALPPITKKHQVDIHVYLAGAFVAAIECKAYLDSCYYVRACDDFKLFRKFGYVVKNYIFTLEDSIDRDTKIFTDYVTDNICDDVFYILDGKRSFAKPVYDKKFRKPINNDSLGKFVDFVFGIAAATDASASEKLL